MNREFFLHFQNLTGQKIFLLIKARNNGQIKFKVYSTVPTSWPKETALYGLEHGTQVKIRDKNYTSYQVHNPSRRHFTLTEKRGANSLYIILEAVPN